MDNEIEYITEKVSSNDIKSNLLKRNQRWIRQKDGSSTINCSMKILIITCIDSRLHVERIFAAKPGEIMVFRNAGNIITRDVKRSVLIGLYEFDIKCIVLMGHTHCGMAGKNKFRRAERIYLNLKEENRENLPLLKDESITQWLGFYDECQWNENVTTQTNELRKFIKKHVDKTKIPVILPCIYDVSSGEVKFC